MVMVAEEHGSCGWEEGVRYGGEVGGRAMGGGVGWGGRGGQDSPSTLEAVSWSVEREPV